MRLVLNRDGQRLVKWLKLKDYLNKIHEKQKSPKKQKSEIVNRLYH